MVREAWVDIAGEDGLTLDITSDLAGDMVRAKVTYKTDDDQGDEDGPVIPPDDGGAWIGDGIEDDLLDSFVLAIDVA